jgi:hypothetical protein
VSTTVGRFHQGEQQGSLRGGGRIPKRQEANPDVWAAVVIHVYEMDRSIDSRAPVGQIWTIAAALLPLAAFLLPNFLSINSAA